MIIYYVLSLSHMARFQTELEEVGPENETLYGCYGCSNTERLVNRTCVRAPEFRISNVALG